MRLKRKIFFLILIVVVVFTTSHAKRSRGRSRGSSSSGSSFWNRKSSKSSTEPKKSVEAPKPTAPKAPEPEIKKQNANLQQSSANNRPIGWDVDGAQKQNVKPVQNPPPYSAGGYPQQNPPPYSAGAYPKQNPPPYSPHQNPPAYGASGSYPPQNPPPYGASGGYAHQNPPPYGAPGGYPHQNPPPYGASGGYPHQNPPPYGVPGGYPHQNPPPYGSPYGGYQQPNMGYGQHQQSSGIMGSLFGGKKAAGYGALGAGYGYGMKKSGGFFGKHTFRNVLLGLFAWHLVSGLTRRPYNVYNYYNQPQEHEEIKLPANILTLCNENATNLCVPGTSAICTQDEKILCVVTMNSATPCQNNPSEMCVNSTISCLDGQDPLCQNTTVIDNSTTINLPCFTNMTVDNVQSLGNSSLLPQSDQNRYCVTTMALPDPTAPIEDIQATTNSNIEVINATLAVTS